LSTKRTTRPSKFKICLQSTTGLPDCLRQTLFEARNQPRFDAFLSAAASAPTFGLEPSRTSADKKALGPARYLFRKRVCGSLLESTAGARERLKAEG